MGVKNDLRSAAKNVEDALASTNLVNTRLLIQLASKDVGEALKKYEVKSVKVKAFFNKYHAEMKSVLSDMGSLEELIALGSFRKSELRESLVFGRRIIADVEKLVKPD